MMRRTAASTFAGIPPHSEASGRLCPARERRRMRSFPASSCPFATAHGLAHLPPCPRLQQRA
eukprot:1627408-Pleurochrysis_carterae.AAC.1